MNLYTILVRFLSLILSCVDKLCLHELDVMLSKLFNTDFNVIDTCMCLELESWAEKTVVTLYEIRRLLEQFTD